MAEPLTAKQMLVALKAEGVRVSEYKKWYAHNRDVATGRPFGPVNGVMIHHTAGTDSLSLVYNGRADLPGPLAHAHLSKGGTVALTGHGRANHAGGIARNAHDAVVLELAVHPRPDSSEPIDGNDHLYGLEIENRGNGDDPYPDVQYDQAVRWAAAICRAHRWSEHSVIGHREATRRKIDPMFDMNTFRRDVAMRLDHAAGWKPGTPDQGAGTVALTKTDVAVIFHTDNVIKSPDHLLPEITNKFWTAETYVYETYRVAREAKIVAEANGAKLDALIPLELTDAQVASIAAAVAAHPGLVDAMAEAVAVKIAARLES